MIPDPDVPANRLMESQYKVKQSPQDCLSQIHQRLSRLLCPVAQPRLAAIDEDIRLTQALMDHES